MILSRETTLSKLLLLPSEKGSTLKVEKLFPKEITSFLLEQNPFKKALWGQKSKSEFA